MARYTDHDHLAAAALRLVADIREVDPQATYRSLARQCARDPERMAQVLMTLAALVDPDETTVDLAARVEAIVTGRPLERSAAIA